MIEVKAGYPLPFQQQDGVRRPEPRTEQLQVKKLLHYHPKEQLQQFLLRRDRWFGWMSPKSLLAPWVDQRYQPEDWLLQQYQPFFPVDKINMKPA
jgi:hypothetical protein